MQFLLGEACFLDLASIRLWQLGDKFYILWRHVVVQPREAVPDHLAFGQRMPLLEHQKSFDGLTQYLVGHTDHGGFQHALYTVYRVFHLARADLFAAALDDVILACNEVEPTFLVGSEQVARVKHRLAGQWTGLELLAVSFGFSQ